MNKKGSMNNHWIKGKNTLNGLQTKSIEKCNYGFLMSKEQLGFETRTLDK